MPISKTLTLNSDDPFDSIVMDMVAINRKKRADYAGDDHWLQNFYDTAYQLGLTAGHAVEGLIATKQSRLRTLLPRMWNRKGKPQNESVEDTILDRAVYSVLALGILREGGYEPETVVVDS